MDYPSIELAATTSISSNRNGVSWTEDEDDEDVDQEKVLDDHRNDRDGQEYGGVGQVILMPTIRRQNRLFSCSFILMVSSLTIYLVGRVYMTPQEQGAAGLESVLLPKDEGDGGTVDSDAATNARPTRSHASIISFLMGNSTSPSSGKSDLQKWLQHHGRVPPEFWNNHSDSPQIPHHGQANASSEMDASDNTSQVLFDRKKWLSSNVTLGDGVMFETVRELTHDGGAFLEGLTFANGYLFESTGLAGQSSIRKLDSHTGEVIEKYDLEDSTIFGEGLAMANQKLYQLTYKRKIGFIYNVSNITKPLGTFTYESATGEGWGLTHDPITNELIMSDGSDFLHMIDAETLLPTRKVQVKRADGKDARNINELEYFHGRVLANVWFQDIVLVINPSTGIVEKEYDFSSLWPKAERSQKGAEVLNGISVSGHPGHVYITGKNWERMFLVELKF